MVTEVTLLSNFMTLMEFELFLLGEALRVLRQSFFGILLKVKGEGEG